MESKKNDMILNKSNYLPVSFDKQEIKNMYILFISVIFDYLRAFKHNVK